MPFKLKLAVGGLLTISCFAFCFFKLVNIIPDMSIRSAAYGIDANEVADLRFNLRLSPSYHDDLVISDHELITRFLSALRHAVKVRNAPLLSNRAQSISIDFKSSSGRTNSPITLNFNIYSTFGSFGPEFHNMLKILGEYEAKQVHQLLNEKGSQVKAIDFGFARVDEAEEVKKIIGTLKQVDTNDFQYTEDACPCGMQLIFRDNTFSEVYLAIGTRFSHLSITERETAIPPPLRKYCLRAMPTTNRLP